MSLCSCGAGTTGLRLTTGRQFRFPTVLRSCDICPTAVEHFKYNQSAVICHISDAESGHSSAEMTIKGLPRRRNRHAVRRRERRGVHVRIAGSRNTRRPHSGQVRESTPAVVIPDDLRLAMSGSGQIRISSPDSS
jgi:hypothetical protein